MSDPNFSKAGYGYSFDPTACSRCAGNCCRGESGNIWIYPADIREISSYLNLSSMDFISRFLEKRDNRYRLKEKVRDDEYVCIFFSIEKKQCGIYPLRPAQCRSYPFWDYFKKHPQTLKKECPGVNFP